ncbi:PREDICTED: 7-methylguanosine phosphate-specific 5'-nucleotidase isoform X2 [Acromyrmex echinatior]|uniref:7-methylguanosine phosphate-specific 5'-nucleotidase isoform X2 n=1 Tax=Acromyrmex echinatior TaxID=103372 RepID=UPI000580EF2E|nr:PREDICTED: 7-methylguanosine phosphate-specific 5'-nucleotidase isoform X2 [Acromyrmex echinatior]
MDLKDVFSSKSELAAASVQQEDLDDSIDNAINQMMLSFPDVSFLDIKTSNDAINSNSNENSKKNIEMNDRTIKQNIEDINIEDNYVKDNIKYYKNFTVIENEKSKDNSHKRKNVKDKVETTVKPFVLLYDENSKIKILTPFDEFYNENLLNYIDDIWDLIKVLSNVQRTLAVGIWHGGVESVRLFLEFACDSTPPTTMNNELTIDKFPALRSKHVYIKDKIAVLETINAIRQSGVNNLQIVTDFDLTLTKQHIDGRHVLSSFGMFRHCKQLPQQYLDKAKDLYNIYRPIEIDPEMPVNKKADAMRDWMMAAQNLLKGIEFDPHELEEVAQAFDNILRDGTEEFFEKLYNVKVPIIIFSAGLGDIVEAVLRYHNALFDNVKIFSNFLKYNGSQLDGFKNDLPIHVYNKNECALEKNYLKIFQKRQNVLLMGDTIGDANMVEGIEDTKAVLKIGFLYEHVEASLNSFMENFDIVLVDDQTMQVPIEIIQNIL